MSELTNVIVTARKDWSEKSATVTCKDIATGETKEYTLWRLAYKTNVPKPADALCVVGAKLKLGLKYVHEKPNPKGGVYPAQWCIEDAEPLGTVQEVPTEPVPRAERPTVKQSVPVDRDSLIVAQVAWKIAGEIAVARYNALGEKAFNDEGGINSVARTARDVFQDIFDIARDGSDPLGK